MRKNRIKQVYRIFQNSNKKFLLKTTYAVYKQFGFSGLKMAISNKINKRPLLTGIHEDSFSVNSEFTDYDEIGEKIFLRQQNEYTKEQLLKEISSFKIKPLISVIMPIYEPQIKWLIKAIESLQKQYYTNWELCAVDDGSKDRRGIATIEKMAETDSRIRLIKSENNGGISSASNISLKMCNGQYVALIDQDDEITLDAFFWIVKTINENNNVEFMYTDECKIDSSNQYNRSDFFFKPDWSPSLLINYMYTGHLTVYKKDIVNKVGGFRSEFDFSQDYDLALRIGDITKNIVHIERILYYWRTLPSSGAAGGKDFARISNMKALHNWYKRNNLNVIMEKGDRANYGRIRIESSTKVSIIIPTDSLKNLIMSIQGILTNTSYTNIEIVPVTNSKVAEEIEMEYPYLDCLKLCHYNKVYNFSDKCNEGAKIASGEIIIFYNDDVIPVTRDWIEKQIEILKYPNVGGVSPLLLHEDNTIQYAGLITGTPGMIGTAFNGRHNLNPVHNAFNHLLLRDVSILCGAVTVMKKNLFLEIGGFDSENTPNGHSDLDLSLKILEKGYRCVYTPYSVLTHVGNHSWNEKEKADKSDIYCLKRWGKYLGRDMYFTDSMKEMFYGDFGYKYKMYFPENIINNTKSSKDILFVSHELTRTGAPVVLKDMVKVALESGYFPVVICPTDGPLKQEYLEMGVTVIIDESFIKEHWMFEHFARNFDLVVMNTLACSSAINLLENSLPPILWWIHEGSFAIDSLKHKIPKRIGKNVKVFCGGEYALKHFKNLGLKCETNILNYGVEDNIIINSNRANSNKIKFIVAGTYEKRKGQDIFVKAIQLLEEKYKGKAEYIFIGNVLDEHIFNCAKNAAKDNSDIKILKTVTREELFSIYEDVTCVVSPSRDDPMPVVMTEAMMMSKICICSSNTGTSDYIIDGKNGFVFKNEDADELSKKIKYIIDNNDKLENLRKESRKIYEENFSIDSFKEKVKVIFNELI